MEGVGAPEGDMCSVLTSISSSLLTTIWTAWALSQHKQVAQNASQLYASHIHLPELGTRHNCRDNVAMIYGQQFVAVCPYTVQDVATPFWHWGLKAKMVRESSFVIYVHTRTYILYTGMHSTPTAVRLHKPIIWQNQLKVKILTH